MYSNIADITRAMIQVFGDLKNTLGGFAWVMLGMMMISAVFLGYYVMSRLLRRRGSGRGRRFPLAPRLVNQPLGKR